MINGLLLHNVNGNLPEKKTPRNIARQQRSTSCFVCYHLSRKRKRIKSEHTVQTHVDIWARLIILMIISVRLGQVVLGADFFFLCGAEETKFQHKGDVLLKQSKTCHVRGLKVINPLGQ